MKLAVCSIDIDDVLPGCLRSIHEAARAGADLIVLPEEPDITAGAKPGQYPLTDHPLFIQFSDNAAAAQISIVFTLSVQDGDGISNTAVILGRDGRIIGTYRKKHPAPSEEFIVTTPEVIDGTVDPFPVYEFEGTRIGLAVCMDIHFPEMFRIYGLKNADIVCLPTMYMDYTGDMLESIEKARAIDNQIYLALSRYVQIPYLAGRNMGYAKVISPDGRIISSTGHRTGIAVAEFDPKWRMPFWNKGYTDMREVFFKLRKPHYYGDIVIEQEDTS